MTAGNLSTHLGKLEDAGYVELDKAYQQRTPVTWVSLTATGRSAFARYTTDLKSLLAEVDSLDGVKEHR